MPPVLLLVALVLGFRAFETNDAARADEASCGSPLQPIDAWGDCIDRREAFVTVLMTLAAAALVGAILTMLSIRRRQVLVGERPGPVPPVLRVPAVVLMLLGVSAIATPIGGSHCGMMLTRFADPPSDRYGNLDAACLEMFAKLGIFAIIAFTLAAFAWRLPRAVRRHDDRVAQVQVSLAAATTVGSVGLMAYLLIAQVWLGTRGGA